MQNTYIPPRAEITRSRLRSATAEALGLVKVDNVSIEANDGVIGVKAVNVQKLFVADGDEFVLSGGHA